MGMMIECEECDQSFDLSTAERSEAPCDDCGPHLCTLCPHCGARNKVVVAIDLADETTSFTSHYVEV